MPVSERLPRTRRGTPRLQTTADVFEYWAERTELIAPEYESFSYSSMICEGDSLYHYGRHFELARILRDKRGRARLVLHNGDSYSGSGGFGPSTSSRQSEARNVAGRTDVPNLVVPFSALEGAGIDFDSITPISVRDERWSIEEHSSRQRPAKLAKMPSGETTTELQWRYNHETHRSEQVEVEVPVYVADPNQTVAFFAGHGWSDTGAHLGADGVWHWAVRRHWLGDSIFRARCIERRWRKPTAEELAQHEAREAWDREYRRLRVAQQELSHECDGWRRHGEPRDYRRFFRAAFAAQGIAEAINRHYDAQPPGSRIAHGRVSYTVTRWATFLSSFDYQEANPLYFLCELPYGAKPNTVDEAIEALKPPEVVAALARGLNVIRQGDLFAIPTKLTKRQIRRMAGGRRANFEKRLRVLGTNHSVSEGIVLKGGAVLGRGVMRHEPEGWRAPDHAHQKLGNNWHLLVRNTVPRTR